MFLNSTCSSVSSSAEFTNVSKMSNSHGNGMYGSKHGKT